MSRGDARVRGILLLNTVRFVVEHYGEEAHARVMAALPDPASRGVFSGPAREASWAPLGPIVEYMVVAQRLLAPGDPSFHRRMGRFSGGLSRAVGGFLPMVVSKPIAVRMATKLFRSFYDRGRIEVKPVSEREMRLVLHDFPAATPHCERFCGALEALIGSEDFPLAIEEVACAADGHARCEMRATW